jgi:hypothetical protein
MPEPAAVTLSEYVPAGVPFEFGGGVELPPLLPPHPGSTRISSSPRQSPDRAMRLMFLLSCRVVDATASPNTTIANNHPEGPRPAGTSRALVRVVVVTFTTTFAADVALTVSIEGMLQTAPVGAPVQVSVADPLHPAPPIESKYVAVVPAGTVAEPEPEATISPMAGAATPPPTPVRAIDWGLPGALSVTLTEALALPRATGVKITLMLQLLFGDSDEGQLFV